MAVSTDRRRQATPTQMTIRQRANPLHDTATIDNIAETHKTLESIQRMNNIKN